MQNQQMQTRKRYKVLKDFILMTYPRILCEELQTREKQWIDNPHFMDFKSLFLPNSEILKSYLSSKNYKTAGFKGIFDWVSEKHMGDEIISLEKFYNSISTCYIQKDLNRLFFCALTLHPHDLQDRYLTSDLYQLILFQGFVRNPKLPGRYLKLIKDHAQAMLYDLNNPPNQAGELNSKLLAGLLSLHAELQGLIKARDLPKFKAKQLATNEGIISIYLEAGNDKDVFIDRLLDTFEILVPETNSEELRAEAGKLYTLLQKIEITSVDDLELTCDDKKQDLRIFVVKIILTLGILPLIEGIIGKSVILQYNSELKAQIGLQKSSFVEFIKQSDRANLQISN